MDLVNRLSIQLLARLYSLQQHEDGQAVVEYAVILSFVAVIAVAAVSAFGAKVNTMWTGVATAF